MSEGRGDFGAGRRREEDARQWRAGGGDQGFGESIEERDGYGR